MTDHCPDTDSLVSVATALEWELPARLDHLAACQRCRAVLVQLADLHRELAAVPPLPDLDTVSAAAHAIAGLPDEGRAADQEEAAPAPAGAASRQAVPLVTGATFLVAGATTLLVITLLAGNPSAPLALGMAAAAGLAAIAPLRLPFRRRDA